MELSRSESQLSDNEALDDLVAARPMSILGTTFLVGLVATLLFSPPRLPVPATQLLGIAFVGAGFLAGYWAVKTMARGGASPDAFRPPVALVTQGPFRLSRNPNYLGFVLIYAGVGLFFNSLWIVLLTAGVIVGLQKAIIVHDERLLESRFGDEYRVYRDKVRRWF